MRKINRKSIVAFFFIVLVFFNTSQTSAASPFIKGLENTAKQTGYTSANSSFGTKTPEQIIAIAIQALLGVIGVILLALLIYGGYIWMNAKGNDTDVKKAQDIIRNAIIGIIIVLAAYAISNLVFTSLNTTDIKEKSY